MGTPRLVGERFLTVEELAELWKVSRRKVQYLITNGDLRAVRIGMAYRIPLSAYHEYMEKATVKSME